MVMERRTDRAVALFLSMGTFFGGVSVGSIAQDHFGKPNCRQQDAVQDHRRDRVAQPDHDSGVETGAHCFKRICATDGGSWPVCELTGTLNAEGQGVADAA